MKLATLRDGTRDGRLHVVDRRLKRAADAGHIVPTLREAVERWTEVEAALQDLAARVESGRVPTIAFDPTQASSPLPRSFQFIDAGCYLHHVELVRKSRNAPLPPKFHEEPLMYQGLGDSFSGPCDPIAADVSWGIDLEAEIGVIVDDVPIGTTAAEAGRHIRLLVLMNDISLRNLVAPELAKGFGFLHAKPTTAFAPVAATPDEFGAAWDGARLTLPVRITVNGQWIGEPTAGGEEMSFGFPRVIEYGAKTRALTAGTIVGAGTVSNKAASAGVGCLVEKRTRELLDFGDARTPYLAYGDRVTIDLIGADGSSVLGSIAQTVVPLDEHNRLPRR